MFEVEFIYHNGKQKVLVQASVRIQNKCDCYSQAFLHSHVEAVKIESLTDAESCKFVTLSNDVILALEDRAAEAALRDYL